MGFDCRFLIAPAPLFFLSFFMQGCHSLDCQGGLDETQGISGCIPLYHPNFCRILVSGLDLRHLVEQWLKENRYISEWVGLAASVGRLLIFGADSFLIPTMICILAALTALRKLLTHGMEAKAE